LGEIYLPITKENVMANTGKKSEVIPVKKGSESERFSPRHLLTPFEDMEHWVEDILPRNWLRERRLGWPASAGFSSGLDVRTPKIDVLDRKDELFIKAELPGIDKDDIEVSMTDNTITIRGTSKKEEKEEKGDYYRCEISQGSFSRSMSLPAEVDINKSEAKFKDGILELTLPKLERAKRRNIKVS
jgi:HSP20 family protein